MSEKLKTILAELRSRFEEIYGDRFFYVMRLKERSLQYNNYLEAEIQQHGTATAN
jgi:hypothetical protein